MINKLKEINEKLISIHQKNETELKKQLLIQKILNEKNCFFKMDIETAYSILKDLNINDKDLNNIYKELIDIKNFK